MFKLEQAIHAMRRKGAAGQDGIPPSFLKELGPYRKEELLRIYNLSFNTAKCPGSWLLATIVSLLKAKKPASDLALYRPISLTSCIAKCLERMVANKLYFLAETNGWLHLAQVLGMGEAVRTKSSRQSSVSVTVSTSRPFTGLSWCCLISAKLMTPSGNSAFYSQW